MFNKIHEFDEKVLRYIQNKFSCKFMDKTMVFFTFLGDYAIVWALLFAGLFVSEIYRKQSYILAASIVMTSFITECVIKNIVKRSRPSKNIDVSELLIKVPPSYSFPSGHTATSFSAIISTMNVSITLGIIVIIVASFIGLSRIYLKVHYFSDVIVGAVLGGIISSAVFSIMI